MSMNLYVEAERPATVIVKGVEKQIKDRISFDLWQTPTTTTYEILAMEDKLQGYIDFVLYNSEDRDWPIYADDDIFGQRDPIGYKTINSGKEHIQELNEWIKYCENEDYVIEWYYM